MSREELSLSFPESMGKQLRSIAQAEGVDVSEVLRQAIENHIAANVRAQDFKERLAKRMEEDREVLRDLGMEVDL
jgi:metal-responsive CopG/Arc/MetJ family transcriptional regulator